MSIVFSLRRFPCRVPAAFLALALILALTAPGGIPAVRATAPADQVQTPPQTQVQTPRPATPPAAPKAAPTR